jgi:hypothetical protein
MAESKYHKDIKKALIELAKISGYEVNKNKKYIKVSITHPTQDLTFSYFPDFWIKSSHGKCHIFEILDDELKDKNLIIADLIQAYLIDNLAEIIFIVPEEFEMVTKICKIVGAILEKKGLKKVKSPLIYQISKNEATSKKLIDILKKYSKQDGWSSLTAK